jgi:hypothetical protein
LDDFVGEGVFDFDFSGEGFGGWGVEAEEFSSVGGDVEEGVDGLELYEGVVVGEEGLGDGFGFLEGEEFGFDEFLCDGESCGFEFFEADYDIGFDAGGVVGFGGEFCLDGAPCGFFEVFALSVLVDYEGAPFVYGDDFGELPFCVDSVDRFDLVGSWHGRWFYECS